MQDEPALGAEFERALEISVDPSTAAQIKSLVEDQLFAVLCTQGSGQPYGSVVAFAFSPNLQAFAFSTPTATRKFRLLTECDRVALVVDNRAKYPEDMMQVEALTATGRAERLEPGPEYNRWADLLVGRHPYLKPFVTAPSTALFRVDVVRYFYVTRFQEVRQWVPSADG